MWGSMIVKDLKGRTIYKSAKKTLRAVLEEGVAIGADFSFADFRKAYLPNAALDGIKANGACFWGADLCGADMGLADLRDCDFRRASFEDACLAESDLAGSDLRGSFFSGTIVEGACLDRIRASCPSFWTLDFQGAARMEGAVFCHRGEMDIPVHPSCRVIRGGVKPLVLNGAYCFWGQILFSAENNNIPNDLRQELSVLRGVADGILQHDVSRNANKPIRKREVGARDV